MPLRHQKRNGDVGGGGGRSRVFSLTFGFLFGFFPLFAARSAFRFNMEGCIHICECLAGEDFPE